MFTLLFAYGGGTTDLALFLVAAVVYLFFGTVAALVILAVCVVLDLVVCTAMIAEKLRPTFRKTNGS